MYLNGEKKYENSLMQNRAFLYGDAVSVYFFVKNGKLILAEECYFYLMASMRKMRMKIPMTFTLEFFMQMFEDAVATEKVANAQIHFIAFRNQSENILSKIEIEYCFDFIPCQNPLMIRNKIEVDLLKEISVNNSLLSSILVHCPENIYAEIYAQENDLQELILLNPNKRIARGIYGNFLFLEGETIKIPKQTEGAYISPLMENFVTYLHKNQLATIEEVEMSAFESQKSEEILLISDSKGIASVKKIRNKEFSNQRFSEWTAKWESSFNE